MEPVFNHQPLYNYNQVTFSRSATIVDTKQSGDAVDASTSTEKTQNLDIVDINRKTILLVPTTEETVDKQTVDKIKTLAQSLSDKKVDIDSRIQSALTKVGFSAGVDDNLKIEIDSKGKILVSGVADRNMARQIQQELNKDETLARDIKDFRRDKSNFSHILKETTGFGLDQLTLRQISFDDPDHMAIYLGTANRDTQMLRDSDNEELAAYGNSISLLTSEDIISFQDIPLFAGEDELLNTILGLNQRGEVDFARENPGIVDPLYHIEKIGRDVVLSIHKEFQEYNRGIREEWEGDEEEIEKRLLRAGDFQMRVDENGMVEVDGTFSKSKETDHTGQQIVEEQLKAAFDGPGLFGPLGVDSSLKTAMGRFLELHEDNFGDTDEFHHSLGFNIKNGMAISAYAYSPEAETASTAEIGTAVTKYLEASGISDADQLEIEVGDEGKIVLATPIADEALAKQVEGLLDELNSGLAKATGKDDEANFESDGSALGNAIAEIAPHLKHVMSHRPGGGHLSVATPDEVATEDEAKLAEQKELFDKNLMIQKGTVPGTRSARKPFIVRSFERLA